MSWLVLGIGFVIVVVVPAALLSRTDKPERQPERPVIQDKAALQAAIELHTIRRRLDVGLHQAELRWDSQRLRRQLQDELDQLEERW